MKKILVVQPLHSRAIDLLENRSDIEYEVLTDFSEKNLLSKIYSADAITIRDAPISETVLAYGKQLKVISRHGVGFNNIPIAYCTRRGIPVAVVGSVNTVSVAEHTIFLLLAAARVVIGLDEAVRSGNFNRRGEISTVELCGKNLLLIGFGRIGQEVAKRATAFGMRILVHDPYLKSFSDPNIKLIKSLEDGLQSAELVSLHVPLTDETKLMLGERELGLLPRGAILVNTSRGGLLDEAALARAVASGALHSAGLDTFSIEPLPSSSPLIAEKRIVLSPHSASLTEDTFIAMGLKTVENVLDGLDGKLKAHLVVNSQVLKK